MTDLTAACCIASGGAEQRMTGRACLRNAAEVQDCLPGAFSSSAAAVAKDRPWFRGNSWAVAVVISPKLGVSVEQDRQRWIENPLENADHTPKSNLRARLASAGLVQGRAENRAGAWTGKVMNPRQIRSPVAKTSSPNIRKRLGNRRLLRS